MSLLSTNLRLFARLSPNIHTVRVNASTTTSNNVNQAPILTRSNSKQWRTAAVIVGVVGLIALFRMSRKQEQLIEHTVDKQPQPPTTSSK